MREPGCFQVKLSPLGKPRGASFSLAKKQAFFYRSLISPVFIFKGDCRLVVVEDVLQGFLHGGLVDLFEVPVVVKVKPHVLESDHGVFCEVGK